MNHKSTTWTANPYDGLAWRPQDLSIMVTSLIWTGVVLFIVVSYGANLFFIAFAFLSSTYLLVGRFYHDAHLRRQIRYELSNEGLAVLLDGRDKPECIFKLSQLSDIKPQFVTKSGRGTIELPPGGWAREPAWMNRWNTHVPAMYPCRRLELIADVEAVANLIRLKAGKMRG